MESWDWRRVRRSVFRWACCTAAAVLGCSNPAAEQIVGARYAEPATRYGHFALGRPHEYARVVVRTDTGRELSLSLPEDEVFEDLAPRLVRMTSEAPVELLAIVSARRTGARLALIGLTPEALAIVASSAPIGTPNRWLNPVGVADLDGDGRAEIAAVTTPHIGGVLRVYRRQADHLDELAALNGFSNHVYGTDELRLSTAAAVGGRLQLLVPDQSRRHVRAVALIDGRLVETQRCTVATPVDGPATLGECVTRLGAGTPGAAR